MKKEGRKGTLINAPPVSFPATKATKRNPNPHQKVRASVEMVVTSSHKYMSPHNTTKSQDPLNYLSSGGVWFWGFQLTCISVQEKHNTCLASSSPRSINMLCPASDQRIKTPDQVDPIKTLNFTPSLVKGRLYTY